MIFLFLQTSLSKYTLDFTSQNISNGKYFKLFLEPFDIVEIKVNATYWTLFSNWLSAEKVYLTIITEKSNQTIMEFGPYKSDLKISAVHFNEYNCTFKLTSDSADEQKISLMILPDIYDKYFNPTFLQFNNQEFPFVQKYNGTSVLIDEPDYPIYYDAESTSSDIIAYLFAGFAGCYVIVIVYSDREFIKNSLLASCMSKILNKPLNNDN